MPAGKILMTAEEFDNYPFEEDKRYELDEGEFFEMSRPGYKHNRVLKNLQRALDRYFLQHPTGEWLLSENLYALSAITRLAPDAAIILGNHSAELASATVIPIVPDIVAEVLSPSERPGRLHHKLSLYFKAGIKEVWVIDPEDRDAEIWTGANFPEHLTGSAAITSALLPGFAVTLEELFS